MQIALAGSAEAFLLGSPEHGKQQRCQNRDNSNDNEQFDQRERAFAARSAESNQPFQRHQLTGVIHVWSSFSNAPEAPQNPTEFFPRSAARALLLKTGRDALGTRSRDGRDTKRSSGQDSPANM